MTKGYEFGDFDPRSPNFQEAMRQQAQTNRGGSSPYVPLGEPTWKPVISTGAVVGSTSTSGQSSTASSIPHSSGNAAGPMRIGRAGNPHAGKVALACVLMFPLIVFGGAKLISDYTGVQAQADVLHRKALCEQFWTGRFGRTELAAAGHKMAAVQSQAMRECPQATPQLNGPQPGR